MNALSNYTGDLTARVWGNQIVSVPHLLTTHSGILGAVWCFLLRLFYFALTTTYMEGTFPNSTVHMKKLRS